MIGNLTTQNIYQQLLHMKEPFENTPPQEKPASILDTKRLRECIKNRDIRGEYLPVIEKLGRFPREFFYELTHNFWSGNKEQSINALNRATAETQTGIEHAGDDKDRVTLFKARVHFFELWRALAEQYDWTACWNLQVVFENEAPRISLAHYLKDTEE